MNILNKLFLDNKKILINYLNLTFIQILNSFFYLLIYPFVINSVGLEDYGRYVFYNSFALYFYVLVNYGFDIHGAKSVASNPGNLKIFGNLFFDIFFAKLLLFVFSTLLVFIIFFLFKTNEENKYLFFYCFLNVASCVFMTSWYFHGVQKLYIVTSAQLFFKLISLPLIYVTLNSTDMGISAYALIVSLSNVASSIFIFALTIFSIKEIKCHVDFKRCLSLLSNVLPYFLSTACIAVKQRSIELIIGNSMGMTQLALYDLAYKIFSIPTLLVSNINTALLPRFSISNNDSVIKKVIRIEVLIGVFIVVLISIFAKYFIEKLFGVQMLPAYLMSILLSFNIFSYLVVSAYMYFVFIPQGNYNFILKNQVISILSFYFICLALYFFLWNTYAVLIAMIFSGIVEIAYCKYSIYMNRKSNGKI